MEIFQIPCLHRTIAKLKKVAKEIIRTILLERVNVHFYERFQQCSNKNGYYLPDVIFRLQIF